MTFDSDFRATLTSIGDAVRAKERARGTSKSNHVQILRDHGTDVGAHASMIEFYAKLAQPNTTGGVVILLERPSPAEKTRYGGGYHTVISKTKTLKEVARLIKLVTNGGLTIEKVTVLDAFPLQPKDDPSGEWTWEHSQLLNTLLAAKKPDVVLSCFRAKRHHQGVIRRLQHPGVGHISNNSHQVMSTQGSHEYKKIDAFHPSYAISYHADQGCFHRLLEVQFAKAFGEWCEVWQEASWMDELREGARTCKDSFTGMDAITSQVANMSLSMARSGIVIGSSDKALYIPQRLLDHATSTYSRY